MQPCWTSWHSVPADRFPRGANHGKHGHPKNGNAGAATIVGMRTPPIVHARRLLDPTGRFRVEEVDLEFANGARRTFERLQSGGLGAVIIVPMRDDATVLLVREYAAGLHRYELGLPKGRIDAGESAPQAADRELKEEIGFGARELVSLVPLALAPSYMSH